MKNPDSKLVAITDTVVEIFHGTGNVAIIKVDGGPYSIGVDGLVNAADTEHVFAGGNIGEGVHFYAPAKLFAAANAGQTATLKVTTWF
jgi:hypothetical protein